MVVKEPVMSDLVGMTIPCLINCTNYDLTNFSMLSPDVPRLTTSNKLELNNTIPLECVYAMDWTYTRGITAFFADFLPGVGGYNSRQGKLNGMPILTFRDSWWLNAFYNNGLATHESISKVFKNIATVLTNSQRITRPDYLTEYASANKSKEWAPSTVQGLVQTTSICTQFNWPWLLFPAILLIATALLFLITIVVHHLDGRDLPVWKTSLLPLLFYGLSHRGIDSGTEYRGSDTDSGDRSENLLGVDELTKIAEHTTVRFRRTVQGGGFEEIHR